MSLRGLIVIGIVVILLGGAGYGVWSTLTQGEPPPTAPEFKDDAKKPLAPAEEFERLAHEDPVALLGQCLSRYTREVKSGARFTIEKQERIQGKPKHPEMPSIEILDVCVRGDVPDPETKKTTIEVLMKWKSGARKVFGIGAEIRGTFFSEKPKAEGGLDGKTLTWRPEAGRLTGGPLSEPMDPNIPLAKDLSRYCIRDAGLYRAMLRTHEAWQTRQAAGELKIEYLGKKTPEKIGRACYVIKRICPRTELDSFEVGGTATNDPKVVATEGFTEVTIYVDVERWLQVGTELYRTEPDGTRVLVGTYYFRDVQLNPAIPPDTFTITGLKK